jgi:hypothetical protein
LLFLIATSYFFDFYKILVVLAMESQGNVQDVGAINPTSVTGGPHHVANPSIFAQRPPIPPTPFFHGYSGASNQMPFLYPHSYMPPIPGFGFGAPTQGSPSVTIDLTEGSQKRGPQGSVNDRPQPIKKKRATKKKPEIVHLDDAKDDVDLLKNAHHWKDHWVIHLISLRGEMQNTFNAPPKQGMFFSSHLFFLIFFSFCGTSFGFGYRHINRHLLATLPNSVGKYIY